MSWFIYSFYFNWSHCVQKALTLTIECSQELRWDRRLRPISKWKNCSRVRSDALRVMTTAMPSVS